MLPWSTLLLLLLLFISPPHHLQSTFAWTPDRGGGVFSPRRRRFGQRSFRTISNTLNTLLERGGGSQATAVDSKRRVILLTTRSSSSTSTTLLKSSNEKKNIQDDDDNDNSKNDDDDDDDNNRLQRGMAAALGATYLTVMAAKCALPSVLPLLKAPDGTGLSYSSLSLSLLLSPQELFARLLLVATLSVAFGKVLLGPVIDHFGGIASLQAALIALAALLAFISVNQSFLGFAIAWIAVDFIFSSCWASCINAIHQSFPPEAWSRQIGTLAISARIGNAMAFAGFSVMLQFFQNRMRQAWRPIFLASAVLQALPIGLLRFYGPKVKIHNNSISQSSSSLSKSSSSKPSFRSSLPTLSRLAKTQPAFWLHLISRSVLMVFASFLLFVPSLLRNVYGASPAASARGGSIYALGCLLSVTFGSRIYNAQRLSKRGKVTTMIALLTLATLSSAAQLGHAMGILHLSVNASAAMLFVWGFSMSLPFYIPPSLYSLDRGGAQSSATIADAFDVVGFGLLALFNLTVERIATPTVPAAWIFAFQLTTTAALVSLLTLPVAILLE
jgi:MFS family permease